MWLLEHRHCKKVVLIKDESQHNRARSLCRTKGPILDYEAHSVSLIDDADAKSFENSRFLPFLNLSVLQQIEDSSGNIWEISIEIPENKGSTDALLFRSYKLRSLSSKECQGGNGLQSPLSNDRFFEVISLNAQWDVDQFPILAEFKRQVAILYCVALHNIRQNTQIYRIEEMQLRMFCLRFKEFVSMSTTERF